MLTEHELRRLMGDTESDRVERTTSTKATDKFSKAICAFANDLPNHRMPGYLLIGVDNVGHECGLKVTDQLLQDLGAIRANGQILPLPAMAVQKHSLAGGDVAVVEVQPSDLPPVRYEGRIWVRVGPRRAIANEAEERILVERRASRVLTFDAQACRGCCLSDLVQELFLVTYRSSALAPEIVNENNRDMREQMASLRFYDLAKDCATYAGALLFGKEPRAWMPGAYIQYLHLPGVSLTDDPIDDRRFEGDLVTVLHEVDAFLGAGDRSRPVPETALREHAYREYPLVALRELLMNAVMHRAYDATAPIRFYRFTDRIEIQNPGGLYGEATPENFPRQTAYRNPVIAEAMKSLGYVNVYGRGVARAQQALKENGNPDAEFALEPTYFLATIRRRT